MKKIGLVPEREWAYLLRSGKHSFSCLKGDVIGQVHTNDLSEDKVYYIRKCNVCGDPFADGSYVHDPIEGLASYVARSESEEKSLDHLHVYGLNNDKADVVRLQPNFFLRGYNPHGLKVERIIPEERRIRVPWIFAPVIGRRDETGPAPPAFQSGRPLHPFGIPCGAASSPGDDSPSLFLQIPRRLGYRSSRHDGYFCAAQRPGPPRCGPTGHSPPVHTLVLDDPARPESRSGPRPFL